MSSISDAIFKKPLYLSNADDISVSYFTWQKKNDLTYFWMRK